MRKFLDNQRLWASPGDPDERWIKPHVLWLPQDQPEAMAYFHRLRTVVATFCDIVTPVDSDDLHLTIQKIEPRTAAGDRVDNAHLAAAAAAVQQALAHLSPFEIEIGPARTTRSAATVDMRPEDELDHLYRRVRAGLTQAGLVLPDPAPLFWGHASIGYGNIDTDTAELARRSDQLASALAKTIRPPTRIRARMASVWLVWERQDHLRNRYLVERVHEIHLGRTQA
ncbi:2'-5' RNA ligase family protein [Streptomyces millisiae]|uniref:2'-5' RNA ligase family protein n=1 Tax=Streptomyces millisiae TaxID=3075542 RepID=A0ABU2LW87_9ACTN|nr:2'-5' RNA ligase family protein [Streptomyces sp. DSM 44918]MDT0321861.1 2'-5' RNA ligase family protein [Streptomyces sp. DSM 44918]